MPLAFGAMLLGVILTIAGVTGSTIPSVAQGKPDRAKAKEPEPSSPSSSSSSTATPAPPVGTGVAGKGLAQAVTQLGTPYKWGGELEKAGFDCSGLVQWAFGRVGVSLPRTAQEQYSATQRLSPGEAQPGDLVFFGSSTGDITHVGIVAGAGKMIDATHTGANVEYSNFTPQIGSMWGSDRLIGYGRP
jgi:peptidoglycan DL-endopeptidase CwlO